MSRKSSSLSLIAMALVATTAFAQKTPAPAATPPQLTAEQATALSSRAKARQRQMLHPEATHVRGATGGVSVGVRCLQGFVEQQHVVPSVADVEIIATKRTECDGSRCRGLEVKARRPDGPFDLDVQVTCSAG